MANLIGLNVYQIGSQDAIPLAQVEKSYFPTQGIFVNGVSAPNIILATGISVYSAVTLTGALGNANQTPLVYYVVETPAVIASMAQ